MSNRSFSPYVLLLAFVLMFTGCSKDEFATQTMAEMTTLTDEIVAKVTDTEDKKAGVAEAQALLDGKKAELEPKLAEIMELRGFQVSEETQAKVLDSMINNTVKISTLEIDLMMETMNDKDLEAALEKLVADYDALIPE